MDQHHTSVGLLDDLQRDCSHAWSRLDGIYTPLIRKWLGRYGIAASDADDIAQDVLIVVLRRLPGFRRRRDGSFRCWLRQITIFCLRGYRRKHGRYPVAGDAFAETLNHLEDPDSGLSRQWDLEHDLHVLSFVMNRVQAEFTEQTWRAFQGTAIAGQRPGEVAAELGTTENAVCIAKSRVSARIRREVRGLVC